MAPLAELRISVYVRHCAKPWTGIILRLYRKPAMLELLFLVYRWGNWDSEWTKPSKVTQQAFVTRELGFSLPHTACPELQFPLRDTGMRDAQGLLKDLGRHILFWIFHSSPRRREAPISSESLCCGNIKLFFYSWVSRATFWEFPRAPSK